MESEGQAFELRRLVEELASRKSEALKLYRPMPLQQKFHDSMARERILRGGNRSGKTLTAAAEIARVVCGLDDTGRFPKTNGVCYCVGFSGAHLADPMWKLLGKTAKFRIIRDEYTREWRVFYPNLPGDAARARESRRAPPLIPRRMIESIAWEERKTDQPKLVTLINGWQIHFFSGNAKPPQGTTCQISWFDEELSDEEWYPEIAARLVDEDGYFIWSATPQAGTEALYRLHERAEEEELRYVKAIEDGLTPEPRAVEEFHLHIDNNIHMTPAQRSSFLAKMKDDDREVRIEGEFAGIHRVYPEWNTKVHEVPFRDIPEDWTRYVGIDPGRQVCAGLFLAVPPPHLETNAPEQIFIYDEFYLKACDAVMFGQAMREKCKDQRFRAFIIDPNAAAQHEIGSGLTVEDHYRKQLRIHGVRSELSGNGFIYGDDNRRAATETIRMWLRARSAPHYTDRYSSLRVIAEKCPNFIWEIKHLKYKKIKSNGMMIVTDDPDERKHTHAFACLRYLAQFGPSWHKPSTKPAEHGLAYKAFLRKKEKEGENAGYSMILGPGK